MYLKRVTELAQYLSENERPSEELVKFLVLKTFADLTPKAIYITELSGDGSLYPVASFGLDKLKIVQWGRFSLSTHLPITECARKGEIVIVRSVEDFFSRFPKAQEIEDVYLDWEAAIAFSMLPFGVALLFLDDQPKDSVEQMQFIETIGALLSLQYSRIPVYTGFKSNGGKSKNENHGIDLTERQKLIHQLMFKGFTNAQIAAEVGYSESLIRQETIQIFRILGVSGRKEIIESPPPCADGRAHGLTNYSGFRPCRSKPKVSASSSAMADAAITFSCTPTVLHFPLPSDVSTKTRVIAPVPRRPSRIRTL
jgi:DNA-binding CsgD family transcriptional regulator